MQFISKIKDTLNGQELSTALHFVLSLNNSLIKQSART